MLLIKEYFNRRGKILLAIIFILVGCAWFLFTNDIYAADEVASGTCGSNLTWVFDDEGTLTISGSGSMPNWSGSGYVPGYLNYKT